MKKSVQILIIAFIGVVTVSTAKAQTYDPLAVQRINDLIANNGLQATPNAPETWDFAEWNDENPKKIIKLLLDAQYMKGDATFAGLTTLQTLCCCYGYLTKLDVINCPQLQILTCADNYLTEFNLTNCNQLQRIYCFKNNLSKLDITNCNKLDDLGCYSNNLTELDVKNCTQLQTLDCSDNNLTEFDVSNCTQLQTLGCSKNRLSKLDLTGLDKLVSFGGNYQSPHPLTLYKNESEEYACAILLNNPTFESSAISYSDGVLKSTDTTVLYTPFTVQTNKEGFKLSGEVKFDYSDDVGIGSIDDAQLMVYPNPATGELIVTRSESQVTSIEIYDVNGRKQKAENKKRKAEGKMIIDISHLPTGIYLIKIITEQGEINKKIVKQ